MAGKSGGLLVAGIVALTSAGAACGYDNSSNPSGPGYRDTTAAPPPSPPGGYATPAAAGRSKFFVFDSPIVARVRIRSGQQELGPGVQDLSDGGNRDLAVMDDYLYAEPQKIW